MVIDAFGVFNKTRTQELNAEAGILGEGGDMEWWFCATIKKIDSETH